MKIHHRCPVDRTKTPPECGPALYHIEGIALDESCLAVKIGDRWFIPARPAFSPWEGIQTFSLEDCEKLWASCDPNGSSPSPLNGEKAGMRGENC